jgi:hypothetical protein
LQYLSGAKEVMKSHYRNENNRGFWNRDSFTKGDQKGDSWLYLIRLDMMNIMVEKLQKAGEKLIDKYLPFGPAEACDICFQIINMYM